MSERSPHSRRHLLLVIVVLVLAFAFAGLTRAEGGTEPTAADGAVHVEKPGVLVTLEPVAAEQALAKEGEVVFLTGHCLRCPTLFCHSEDEFGLRCSGLDNGCRCVFCDGVFGCFAPQRTGS